MGLGLVSHPLYLLNPFLVSALIAFSLWYWFLNLHVLLVCNSTTLYPCVLQYPAGLKMQSASAWVYTFCGRRIREGVGVVVMAGGVVDVVGVGVVAVVVAGVAPPRCIVSMRIDNAASCATIVAKSELLFVAAFAI